VAWSSEICSRKRTNQIILLYQGVLFYLEAAGNTK
jgi:hypothetical protein